MTPERIDHRFFVYCAEHSEDGRLTDMQVKRGQAWEQGWDMAVRCRPKVNPYRLLCRLWHSWESGYEEGKRLTGSR